MANTLVKQGMKTVQAIGIPGKFFDPGNVDAVVIALESRTNPVEEAIANSLAALLWLHALDARQFIFKYCSTFDSTDARNICPVVDALMEALKYGLHHRLPRFSG